MYIYLLLNIGKLTTFNKLSELLLNYICKLIITTLTIYKKKFRYNINL